jgi:hypothetical protein
MASAEGQQPVASQIPDGLRDALAELEAYLDGEPPERLAEHVLVLGSTWTLGDAGFDLERYDAEAKQFRDFTGEHDRALASFPDAMGYYLSLRLAMDADGELHLEEAAERLARVRDAIELRAQWVEGDFPLIAAGFRYLLDETRDGVPPEDRIWRALARRIGDRYVDDWVLRAAG